MSEENNNALANLITFIIGISLFGWAVGYSSVWFKLLIGFFGINAIINVMFPK